jgi:hypothetical protein
MRNLRTALLTVLGGLVLAVVLYALTAPPVTKILGGPNMVITQGSHTDFWTGELTPMIVTTYDYGTRQILKVNEYPEDWKNYRTFPLPVGFAVGGILTLTIIAIASRRPGRPVPNSAVPIA